MSGRTVHAIRIKLHTQTDCSVIIWPNDTAKLCVQLMNPRKTWMTKKPATKPVPRSTYPASLSTWPRRLSLKRFLFHILLRISDFFAANSSGDIRPASSIDLSFWREANGSSVGLAGAAAVGGTKAFCTTTPPAAARDSSMLLLRRSSMAFSSISWAYR
jgi:hypothetical protein